MKTASSLNRIPKRTEDKDKQHIYTFKRVDFASVLQKKLYIYKERWNERGNVAVSVPIAPVRRFLFASASSAALCQSKQRPSVDKQSLSQPLQSRRSKDPTIQRLQRSKDSWIAPSYTSFESTWFRTVFNYSLFICWFGSIKKLVVYSWIPGTWEVPTWATPEKVTLFEL